MADDIADAIEPVKLLISELFQRLGLKDKKIKTGTPATDTDMQRLNTEIQSTEAVDLFGKVRKGMLKDLPQLKAFIEHCCHFQHYQFSTKKCGIENCEICRPPRLPQEIFKTVHTLPDPVPGEDNHYLPFEKVYGTPVPSAEVYRQKGVRNKKHYHL